MYKRNELVERALKDNPTAGLPLFDQGKRRSKRLQHIVERAPRAVDIGTDTRKLAHTTLSFNPDLLADKERIVFNAFSNVPDATNQEIADALGWAVNRVTGRTFRLRELGYLVPATPKKRICKSTGNVVRAWRVASKHKQGVTQ